MNRNLIYLIPIFFAVCGSAISQTPVGSVFGIDLSKWNKEVEWDHINQDSIQFCYIRASQGKKIRDELCATHRAGAMQQQLPYGYYHFFVTTRKGRAQARYFYKSAGRDFGDLVPVVDFERYDGGDSSKVRAEIAKCMDWIARKCDCRPMLYAPELYYKAWFGDSPSAYPLWIARYRAAGPERQDYAVWQMSDKAKVSGVKGPTDLNVIRSGEDLSKIRIKP